MIQQEIRRVLALSETVIDQIAAGEVVERPSHLVKELMENSLDAGATSLSLDVADGGRSVTVKDNGHGIHRDDLSLILKRHTTSKIKSAEDLWQLSSFGFRGEALSSISAVSKLRVLSRRQGVEDAFQVESHFGRELPLDAISHDVGTTIEVSALFENLPARLKFLKSGSAEVSAIRQMVKAMALVNPTIEFRFRVEGELDFYAPKADNFFERVKYVLGEERLCLATAEREGARIELVFSDPHVVQKTSRSLWFFVQGRPVQDRSLQAALLEAYRGTLMHGEYPMAVLSLQVPPDEVDVNIHPTKSQVKFLKPQQIFSFVHHTLRRGLEDHLKPRSELKADPVAPMPQTVRFDSPELQRVQYQTKDLHMPLKLADLQTAAADRKTIPNFAPKAVEKSASGGASGEVSGQSFSGASADSGARNNFNSSATGSRSADARQTADLFSESLDTSDLKPEVAQDPIPTSYSAASATSKPQGGSEAPVPNAGMWSRMQVLAQAHLTYLVCQSDQGLCLVDQHAAHERVLFETLSRMWRDGKGASQALLFPLAVDLSGEHLEALESVKEPFQKMGLVWELLGPSTLGIVQLPELVKETALPGLLKKVADDILEKGGSFEFEKAVHEIISTMACHSAIRAGQALSIHEMQSLLQQMDEFSFSQFCPHGRPVSVKWSVEELEREFGRRK